MEAWREGMRLRHLLSDTKKNKKNKKNETSIIGRAQAKMCFFFLFFKQADLYQTAKQIA